MEMLVTFIMFRPPGGHPWGTPLGDTPGGSPLGISRGQPLCLTFQTFNLLTHSVDVLVHNLIPFPEIAQKLLPVLQF